MQKIKRNERIGALMKTLTDTPNHIYTFNYFSQMFNAAKSTICEDVAIAKNTLEKYGLGKIETVTGASGGVKFLPDRTQSSKEFVKTICNKLKDPGRILPGGYLYMLDILSFPDEVVFMGEILAMWFHKRNPDFVLTIETKGIPVALMAARALNVPLLVARRDTRISDGSVVTINYVTGSSHRIQKMSLAKRSVGTGQKALIIDDFMKGGGSAKGLMDMMCEFSVTVVGVGVVISTKEPVDKLVKDYKSLMVLHEVNEINNTIDVRPSKWITDITK